MRLDTSLHTALYEQGCLRYPGPKTGYRWALGLTSLNSEGQVYFYYIMRTIIWVHIGWRGLVIPSFIK